MIQRRKTATLNLRIEPEIKAAAEKAAAEDRRSLTSLLEMLLLKHLRRRGYLKALLVAATTLMIAGPAWGDAPIVAMYGDSTTAGTTGTPATGYAHISPRNEPQVLQEAMDAVIENHGIPGITCFDLLNGGRGVAQNWWQEMAASKATVVTINVGINDVWRGYTEAVYTDCLKTLVAIAQDHGKVAVIETSNPIMSPLAGILESYAAAARGVAMGNGAYLIDQFLYVSNCFWGTDGKDWRSHTPGGLHPDDALYAYKAAVAYTVLRPLVTTLAAP